MFITIEVTIFNRWSKNHILKRRKSNLLYNSSFFTTSGSDVRCHIGRGGALALLNRLDFSLVMKNDLHGLGDHGDMMMIMVLVALIMAFAIIRFGPLTISSVVQNIPFLALVHFYHYFNCSESSPVPVDDYNSKISKVFCKRRASNGGVKAANNEEALHSSVKWVFLPQFDYQKAFDF